MEEFTQLYPFAPRSKLLLWFREIGLCPKSMIIYLALNLVNVSMFTLCS